MSANNCVPIRLYDAFTDRRFGGNIAGVVYEAEKLDEQQMLNIATELKSPTTGFLSKRGQNTFGLRFFTPKFELTRCGHVMLGCTAALLDEGYVSVDKEPITVTFDTKSGPAEVLVFPKSENDLALIMMKQTAPTFRSTNLTPKDLIRPLGIADDLFADEHPFEIVSTGLNHLFVPVKDRETMGKLIPDTYKLLSLSYHLGVETINVFTLDTENDGYQVHSRDFAPAYSDPEESASGTTNSALACYLVKNGIVTDQSKGKVVVQAEQGFEMRRPSFIRSEITLSGTDITEVWVGGTAVRTVEGKITC